MDMEDEDEVVVVAFFLSIAKLARVVQGSRYCCFFNLVLTLPFDSRPYPYLTLFFVEVDV